MDKSETKTNYFQLYDKTKFYVRKREIMIG